VAVVLVFRVAVAVAGAGHRVVKIEQSATGQPGPFDIPAYLWDRLRGEETDEELGAAISAHTGRLATVTTFDEPFELRKAQVRWGRSSGAAAGTDDAVTTHHFIKLSGGTPTDDWLAADFQAIEAAFAAFWTTIKTIYVEQYSYKQMRWYKAGPDIVPPQAPVRVIDPAVVGTSASTTVLPPQAALSITEKTTDPKSWGRFYLPPPHPAVLDANTSRLTSATQTFFADAVDTMYQAFLTAGTPAVVYSSAKPSRATAGGGTLPARDARALTVDEIQVDDLMDVIRSRRWNEPLLRVQRAIS
jgi:hypothetical protein